MSSFVKCSLSIYTHTCTPTHAHTCLPVIQPGRLQCCTEGYIRLYKLVQSWQHCSNVISQEAAGEGGDPHKDRISHKPCCAFMFLSLSGPVGSYHSLYTEMTSRMVYMMSTVLQTFVLYWHSVKRRFFLCAIFSSNKESFVCIQCFSSKYIALKGIVQHIWKFTYSHWFPRVK